jgi:hypothetical protein
MNSVAAGAQLLTSASAVAASVMAAVQAAALRLPAANDDSEQTARQAPAIRLYWSFINSSG